MKVTCPTCKRDANWADNPFRPFCSERCRLIDLGAWLSEQRAIPADAPAEPAPSADNEAEIPPPKA